MKLGLETISNINDANFLSEIKKLTALKGDARAVWAGAGYASSDVDQYKVYALWANNHWALYYGFIHNVLLSGKTILDLGCASGFATINLSQITNDCKITGYDIDAEIIDFANKYNKNENITYITENIINSDLQLDVDFIFLVETLEHIRHAYHYGLIDKCLNCLKNDESRLFLVTPNEEKFLNDARGHIGILTTNFFNIFKSRYAKNIVSVEYYDNTKLDTHGVTEYTTKNNKNSHYKIIMKK